MTALWTGPDWVAGTNATNERSLYWAIQLRTTGTTHKGVIEGGGRHRFFLTACGRWLSPDKVNVRPMMGHSDRVVDCRRCQP